MTPSPRRARALLLVACVAPAAFACVASLGCGGSAGAKEVKKEEGLKKREPARVRVAAVEQREMVRVLSTTTTVESETEVKVFPRTAGVLVELFVEEGAVVKEGDVLAQLDAREKDAQIEEARVALREAQDAIQKAAIMEREAQSRIEAARLAHEQAVRDYERNEKANLIAQQALEALRMTRDTRKSDHETAKLAFERSQVESKAAATALEKAEIALKTRELERTFTSIVAPFTGVIAERLVRRGDSVGPGAPAFVLTDAENLRAVLHRPQRELPLFAAAHAKKGDAPAAAVEIRATAEAFPDVAFKGEIQRVSPSIDAQSGSFRVTVRLAPAATDAPAKRLLPGMLVRVEIVTDRHPDALVVPKRALRREGEIDLVFVARAGTAHRVEVEEGFADDASVEVRPTKGELARGDQVIVVGNRELEEGSEVQLEETAVAPPTPEVPAATNPTEAPRQG